MDSKKHLSAFRSFFGYASFSFLFLFFTSCSYYLPQPPCPPPPSVKCPLTKTFTCDSSTIPIAIPLEDDCLNLTNLVDLALQNRPETRLAWFNAKAAAADLGTARGVFLPQIALQAQIGRSFAPSVTDGQTFTDYQTIYGPTLSTNYLLIDFGGRSAAVSRAKQALEALNWTYNWEVQTVIINVLQNYYSFVNAKAILEADEESAKDNYKIWQITKTLRESGVSGLADELQSQTNYVQAILDLQKDHGALHVSQVTLSQSLGIPLDSCYHVFDLPENFEVSKICDDVEKILCLAKTQRADLASLRSTILQRRANIRVARSQIWPTLSTQISGGKTYIDGEGPFNTFSTALSLNFNIFNSFSDTNALRKAQAQWEAAQAQLDQQELSAFLNVLTDYYEFQANTEILKYSYDFLNVAQKNQEVSMASYQAGTKSIIDLITAQNALTSARQQLANAKTNWLTSLANLSYDTGGLMCPKVKEITIEDENLTIIKLDPSEFEETVPQKIKDLSEKDNENIFQKLISEEK